MQNIFASPDISPDGTVDTTRVPPQPKHNTGNTATAHSNVIRPRRQVKARDVHPGDVMQQYDWSLHVREVDVGPGAVAITCTEFGFRLHCAADEQVTLAA